MRKNKSALIVDIKLAKEIVKGQQDKSVSWSYVIPALLQTLAQMEANLLQNGAIQSTFLFHILAESTSLYDDAQLYEMLDQIHTKYQSFRPKSGTW